MRMTRSRAASLLGAGAPAVLLVLGGRSLAAPEPPPDLGPPIVLDRGQPGSASPTPGGPSPSPPTAGPPGAAPVIPADPPDAGDDDDDDDGDDD